MPCNRSTERLQVAATTIHYDRVFIIGSHTPIYAVAKTQSQRYGIHTFTIVGRDSTMINSPPLDSNSGGRGGTLELPGSPLSLTHTIRPSLSTPRRHHEAGFGAEIDQSSTWMTHNGYMSL